MLPILGNTETEGTVSEMGDAGISCHEQTERKGAEHEAETGSSYTTSFRRHVLLPALSPFLGQAGGQAGERSVPYGLVLPDPQAGGTMSPDGLMLFLGIVMVSVGLMLEAHGR